MPLASQLQEAISESFIVRRGEKVTPGKSFGSFSTAEVGGQDVTSFKVKTADGANVVIMVRGGPTATGKGYGMAEILAPGLKRPYPVTAKKALQLKDQIPLYDKSELLGLISGKKKTQEDLNRRFEEALVEFQLFGRTKGDLRGAKKGQTITYKSKEGGEKKLMVVSIGRHKGFGKMVVAKDQKGSQYHLPLNDEGQATVVLRKTGDPKDPNETMADIHAMPKAWVEESERDDNLDEAGRVYTHIFQVPEGNRKEMERFLKQKQEELKGLEKRIEGAKAYIKQRAKELRVRPDDWQLTNRKLRDEYEKTQLAIQMAQGSLERMKESLDEAAGELGRPEVITGMRYGGTRYKYLHGVNIDHVEKDKEFIVWQADYPKSKRLGTAKTLKDAEKLALQKADLSQRRGE